MSHDHREAFSGCWECRESVRSALPMFPVQQGPLIPWSVAEFAYMAYAKRYGTSQSLERLAQRGGFGVDEMDELYPAWRTAALGISTQRERAEKAEGEVQKLRELVGQLTSKLAEKVPAEVHERGWQWRPVTDDTAFAPPFATVRACLDCRCLVAGGPTRCGRCAAAGPTAESKDPVFCQRDPRCMWPAGHVGDTHCATVSACPPYLLPSRLTPQELATIQDRCAACNNIGTQHNRDCPSHARDVAEAQRLMGLRP